MSCTNCLRGPRPFKSSSLFSFLLESLYPPKLPVRPLLSAVPSRLRHSRATAQKSTHISKHNGRFAGSGDSRFGDYNPPVSMSRNAARRWSKVAAPLVKEKDGLSSESPEVEERQLKVDFEEHGLRLDEFLEERLKIRKNLARLKVLNHEVAVRGSAHARFVDLKPAGQLHAGDVVVVVMPKRRKPEAEMTKKERKVLEEQLQDEIQVLRANILFKDEQILVLNKPAGLAVQGGSKMGIHLDKLLDGLQFDAAEPPRLVHRLDKDTTGALLLARTKEAAVRLSNLFKSAGDGVEKSYLAVVCALPEVFTSQSEFTQIVTGIVQVGKPGVEKMSTVEWYDFDATSSAEAGIKKAVTEYRILESGQQASVVELRPSTGRKHQLRLHCAKILKAPILGDYKYGAGCPKSFARFVSDPRRVPLHLHMRSVILKDWYGTGADLEVKAPLPSHMKKTLQSLRIPAP
ncbi:hypothetical protein SpCBS45565_g02495 [Spizellomyces sp. 'palustris']|nr:hypothetical protein SpCBS45565_g02495 [Spizellomyces sp. 'palustris']